MINPAKEKKEDYFEDEFGDQRDATSNFDEDYGRCKADHPIRCLDCNYLKKMFWKQGMQCPMCGSERFFPVVFVDDLDKATGKSKKTLEALFQKKLNEVKKEVKARYKKWLVYLLLTINIGVWGRYFILNIDMMQNNVNFKWPTFYRCRKCYKYFSRRLQDDVGRARCIHCKSISIQRINKKRIAR